MTSTLIPEFRYRIEHDEQAENPRTAGTALTHVVTIDRRRYVPIDDDFGPLSDAWERLARQYSTPLAARIFERYARTIHGAVTLTDRPSDGAFAIWYVMAPTVEWWTGAERGNVEDRQSSGLSLLRDERDEYRAWANNEAVYFVIEKRTTWTNPDHGDMDTWEEVEAVGGFFDQGEAEAKAEAALSRAEEDARAMEFVTEEEDDEVPDAVWDALVAGPASLARVVAATESENSAWDIGNVINEVVRLTVRMVREIDSTQGQDPSPR